MSPSLIIRFYLDRLSLIAAQKLNSDIYLTLNWDSFASLREKLRKFLLRKEVIQPHLPIRLPCYDLTPIIRPTLDCIPLAVKQQASGISDSHGLTGGVYKARERIHRDMLIRDY